MEVGGAISDLTHFPVGGEETVEEEASRVRVLGEQLHASLLDPAPLSSPEGPSVAVKESGRAERKRTLLVKAGCEVEADCRRPECK